MISYPLPIPTSATTANMGSADKTRVAKAQTVLEISCRCVTGQTSMGATEIHRANPSLSRLGSKLKNARGQMKRQCLKEGCTSK